MEMSGQLHAAAALSPGIEPPTAGLVPEPVWTRWLKKIVAPTGNETNKHHTAIMMDTGYFSNLGDCVPTYCFYFWYATLVTVVGIELGTL